jgi:hypothetical protein
MRRGGEEEEEEEEKAEMHLLLKSRDPHLTGGEQNQYQSYKTNKYTNN